MPHLPDLSLDLAFSVGRALFLILGFILAAVTFARWRGAAERTSQSFAEQNTALLAQLAKIQESLADAHRKLDALGEARQDESRRPVVAGNGAAASYQIAIRMARSGAPRDELMASCGLTRQEAELVMRLHAPRRAPKLAATA